MRFMGICCAVGNPFEFSHAGVDALSSRNEGRWRDGANLAYLLRLNGAQELSKGFSRWRTVRSR